MTACRRLSVSCTPLLVAWHSLFLSEPLKTILLTVTSGRQRCHRMKIISKKAKIHPTVCQRRVCLKMKRVQFSVPVSRKRRPPKRMRRLRKRSPRKRRPRKIQITNREASFFYIQWAKKKLKELKTWRSWRVPIVMT